MKVITFLLLCGCIVGCSSTQTRTYDVTVKNESSHPITIWLTKNGPPWEEGWKSPEDIAVESPKIIDRIGGVIAPAGKTAYTGKVTGSFAPQTDAILRVYLGEKKFLQLLAISKGNPDRIETVLHPDVNVLRVTDDGPGIKVTVEK